MIQKISSKGDNNKVGAVMVLGGGVAGIQASLDLADMGYKVYLVEDKPSIGGAMAQLDKTFPTNDCAMCLLSPKLVDTARHQNIEIITNSELQKVDGLAGNFTVTINKMPRYINEEKCTGCGTCTNNCPVRNIAHFDQIDEVFTISTSMRRILAMATTQYRSRGDKQTLLSEEGFTFDGGIFSNENKCSMILETVDERHGIYLLELKGYRTRSFFKGW